MTNPYRNINELREWLKANSSGVYRPAAHAATVIGEQESELITLRAENADLRAKLSEMESQEPVAWMHNSREIDVISTAIKDLVHKSFTAHGFYSQVERAPVDKSENYTIPLYCAPGPADKPAVAVPDGYASRSSFKVFSSGNAEGLVIYRSKTDERCVPVFFQSHSQQSAESEADGMVEFITDLKRSREKYPKNDRMFDGLIGEVDELRRAYGGDGDIRSEALDVAVCAFRIAVEGDSGGNTMLEHSMKFWKSFLLPEIKKL